MTLLQTKALYCMYSWSLDSGELKNSSCLLRKWLLEENPAVEKGQIFSPNWERKQKKPLLLCFCFLPHGVIVYVFHCMRRWLHSCLEISVQGPSASAQLSLVNLSKVSLFHCLLPFLLLGHHCLLFSPAKVTLTSVPVPFFLPFPPFSCYHLSCKCRSPSLLSLANSYSLYPFPEQLKGKTLIKIGETTAFKHVS